MTLARLIDKPVAVVSVPDPAWPHGPRPQSFTWAKQRFVIAKVLDCWVEDALWWEREPSMVVWRVEVQRGGVYEVEYHRGTAPPVWKLRKVYD